MAPLDPTPKAVTLRAAMVSAKRSRTWVPSAARLLEPTFTITRRARATRARGSTRLMSDDIVDRRVQAPREPRGNARRESEQTVDDGGGQVPIVVPARGLRQRLHRDAHRPHERAVDGAADSSSFFAIDPHSAFGAPHA